MNSNSIKLKGRFEIPEPILIDHDYKFFFIGSVTAIQKSTDNQGGYEYIYAIEPLSGEVLDDAGQTVKLVKKGSRSQKLRSMILGMDLEYEPTMSKIMTNLEDIINKYN